jgi:hypothetical protein
VALNLLSICGRALNDISSFFAPTFVVGNNSDGTAETLLAAALKVGEELARDYDWQELSATATVTTVIGQSTYALPVDYERIASDTMWDATQSRRMFGAKTRRQWAEITNAITSSGISYRWRIHGGLIQLDPAPEAVFSFNYEYLSKVYCTDSGGTDRVDGWADDTDLPKLPHDLFVAGIRYYFCDSKVLPRASLAGAEYDAIIKSRQNKNKPAEAANYAVSVVPPRGRMRRVLNIPEVIPT